MKETKTRRRGETNGQKVAEESKPEPERKENMWKMQQFNNERPLKTNHKRKVIGPHFTSSRWAQWSLAARWWSFLSFMCSHYAVTQQMLRLVSLRLRYTVYHRDVHVFKTERALKYQPWSIHHLSAIDVSDEISLRWKVRHVWPKSLFFPQKLIRFIDAVAKHA